MMTANLIEDLPDDMTDQEADLHYCQAILTDIAAAIETLGIPYNLNPEDYAGEIRKLKADRDRARQAGERLAGALGEAIDLAKQLPALQPGGWEGEIIEEGYAALAAWRGQQEPKGEDDGLYQRGTERAREFLFNA